MSPRSNASARAAGARFGDDRLPERFWSRVTITATGCWIWTGAHLASGYGSFRWQGRSRVTHRVAWTALVADIAPGLQVDHLCRNRSCCNPAHLEPVTQAENLRRGHGFGGINAQKDACPQGHPYDEHNTYTRPSAPTTRECRTCRRQNRARHYAKERAA